jgi:hypothetical protein
MAFELDLTATEDVAEPESLAEENDIRERSAAKKVRFGRGQF